MTKPKVPKPLDAVADIVLAWIGAGCGIAASLLMFKVEHPNLFSSTRR